MTDLQNRFAAVYEHFISSVNVYPVIPELTQEHDFFLIPVVSPNKLKGFYIQPRFQGEIELKVHNTYLELFYETGLRVSANEIGLIVSWNVFNRLIETAKKNDDVTLVHIFDYLLDLLITIIENHPNEKLIGLACQTLEYQSNLDLNTTGLSVNEKAAQRRASFKIVK